MPRLEFLLRPIEYIGNLGGRGLQFLNYIRGDTKERIILKKGGTDTTAQLALLIMQATKQ